MPRVQENFDCEERSGSAASADTSVQSRVARLLLKKLSEECEKYCVLSGYVDLPDRFDSDIDFMVSRRDFARIPVIVDEIAVATGTWFFQAIPHETSACAFRLAAGNEKGLTFIQPDSCSDYRHFGKLWLRADEILATRRKHPKGFWIPSASYEFIYYLIKRVNKCDLTIANGARLSSLFDEDSEGCQGLLRRFWRADTAKALAEMAGTVEWQPLMQNMELYRRELRKHPAEKFPSTAFSCFERAHHALERMLHPTGGWIALIGPDGCGKSSVVEGVAAEFAPAFQKILRFHLRPKSLPARNSSEVAVTDPHGQPVRGGLFSVAKLLYLFLDYWVGYLIHVRTAMTRTSLAIFDRYFYDILVDPRRILYGGPSWLPKFLCRYVPKPDLVVLLNAAPEVLWSRKQEVAYEEAVRQQREYLKLAHEIDRAVVIDASRPSSEVVHQVREAILDHYSARTRQRLMLSEKARSIAASANQVE